MEIKNINNKKIVDKNHINKNFSKEDNPNNKFKLSKKDFNLKNMLTGLVTGFVNGLFGAGGGIILVPILNNIFNTEEHKSHATSLAIILFLTITSSIIYMKNGILDFGITYKVAIGSIIGGVLGAKLLSKVTGKFLRITFGCVMILAAVRMIF
ncbi:MAG: sulfite exporter TauE/SafE family protein [Clostridioides sp.]|jgi:uncharacterized membrane protein YfcA|nr:sulfite exporter TauE/SafE family protein [Clostridioides sp.]